MGSVLTAHLRRAIPQFTVPDVVKAAEYYRDILGFRIVGYWDGERALFGPPSDAPAVFAIVSRDEVQVFFNRADSSATRTGRAAGAYDVYIDMTGVNEIAAELHARGAHIMDGPEDTPYGRRELVVKDCNGLILAFGEDIARPRP